MRWFQIYDGANTIEVRYACEQNTAEFFKTNLFGNSS